MNLVFVLTDKLTKSVELNKILYFKFKRLFDILVGILGLTLILPFSLIIKIVSVLNEDYSSIFFKQQRIGKDGKLFTMYKFRTMVPNAKEKLEELLKIPKYKKEWELNQKLENDPRITKIGNFLRKTSLDELPQFINIFIGDMSLIGPRPLVVGELDSHNGNHTIYESVRPGISGWWAANGRSDITYKKRLELEYFYCENCNLLLDIKCIYLTVLAVLLKKGAK